MVVAFAANCSKDYLAFWGTLPRHHVLEELPSGDRRVLLGDFNAHVGIDGETWRGVIVSNS